MALRGGVSYPLELQGARCLTLQELNAATKNFSSINLIGFGMFGEVYKGLLQDGMIVAIKRRSSIPSQQFIQEVLINQSIHFLMLFFLFFFSSEKSSRDGLPFFSFLLIIVCSFVNSSIQKIMKQ